MWMIFKCIEVNLVEKYLNLTMTKEDLRKRISPITAHDNSVMSQSELREHTYDGAKREKMKVTQCFAFAWLVERRACLLWLVEARTIHSETFTEQLNKSLCSCVAFSKAKICAKTEGLKGKKKNIFKPFDNSRFFFVNKSLRDFFLLYRVLYVCLHMWCVVSL